MNRSKITKKQSDKVSTCWKSGMKRQSVVLLPIKAIIIPQ
nr:MAG TPA: hypothetical protein [Caudoviricetes sp.]